MFWTGAPVIPVVVLAYLLHGAFLLVSIGIGIEKTGALLPDDHGGRGGHEPRSSNFALIPRFGMMGAAWATVAGYLVMAALGGIVSQRLYPIPLEAGRLGLIVLAAGVSYVLSLAGPRRHRARGRRQGAPSSVASRSPWWPAASCAGRTAGQWKALESGERSFSMKFSDACPARGIDHRSRP